MPKTAFCGFYSETGKNNHYFIARDDTVNRKNAFLTGLRDGAPICLGYVSVSFAFGLMCTESGLSYWAALLISMTNLTSAGQVAGTNLILSGGGLLEIAVTTFVINVRYLLMSLSLSQKADPAMTTGQRLALSFGITDEIFAVAIRRDGLIQAAYLAGLIVLPYFGWAGGTLLGATATQLLPLALRSALGISIYGMFLAVIVFPARKVRAVAVTVAIAAALRCLFTFVPGLNRLSAGWAIILCGVAASAFAAWRFPLAEDAEKEAA